MVTEMVKMPRVNISSKQSPVEQHLKNKNTSEHNLTTSQKITARTQYPPKLFLIASDWQAVLGQLANGRTAEEFRGAKVQTGAMQHPVSCQQPYSGAIPD